MNEPEPTAVLYAYYQFEDYSGDAEVLYKRGRRYYLVEGGHCSCHGLEGQWEPTEYPTKRVLINCLKKAGGYRRGHTSAMLAALGVK